MLKCGRMTARLQRCGGPVVYSVPATRFARPLGSNLDPGPSPQGGLRGGRSLCEYCTVQIK